jgi:central glycolytic genes regulator
MANVADAVNFSQPTVTVVPARGGLGEHVENQANTIAATMANKLGGKYRMLHVPDGVSEEMMGTMLVDNNNIISVTDMIKQANVLIHGIGQASKMAVRRGCDKEFVERLVNSGAVGEALGHYCTITGKNIYITSSVGLQLDNLADIGLVIAVAGGRQKAEAIIAVTSAGRQDVLVTDESAARAIQSII